MAEWLGKKQHQRGGGNQARLVRVETPRRWYQKKNIKGGKPPFPKKAFCASATIGYLGGQCPVASQAPWPSNAIALLAHTVRSRNTSPLLGCNRCDTRRPADGRRGMPPDVNRGANAPLAFFPSCSFSTYWIKSYTQPVGPQRSGEPRNGGSGTSPFARCFSRGFRFESCTQVSGLPMVLLRRGAA